MFFFSIGHQSTSNDGLKPVMTTGLINIHIDQSIANRDQHLINNKRKNIFSLDGAQLWSSKHYI